MCPLRGCLPAEMTPTRYTLAGGSAVAGATPIPKATARVASKRSRRVGRGREFMVGFPGGVLKVCLAGNYRDFTAADVHHQENCILTTITIAYRPNTDSTPQCY